MDENVKKTSFYSYNNYGTEIEILFVDKKGNDYYDYVSNAEEIVRVMKIIFKSYGKYPSIGEEISCSESRIYKVKNITYKIPQDEYEYESILFELIVLQ